MPDDITVADPNQTISQQIPIEPPAALPVTVETQPTVEPTAVTPVTVEAQIPDEPPATSSIATEAQPPVPLTDDERKKAIEAFIRKNSEPADMVTLDTPTPYVNAPLPTYTPSLMDDATHIVTEAVTLKQPPIVTFISSLFFMITFTYSTLSLVLFAVLVALTIALTNAGSPGFIFLRYYPKVGVLPLFAAGAAMIFLYVAYRLRDGSRQAWVMAVFALATLPVTFSVGMPVLSYPLVKLVSVYAGSPEKPLLTPGITVTQLTHIFSVFLAFDLILIALLVTIRYFKSQPKALSVNAKTSLLIVFLLFFVPASGAAGYGYYQAANSDYGIAAAANVVPFKLYVSNAAPGGRVLSSTFQMYEELANQFNAVKVVYDVPLPSIIQTGKNSPITLKQVQVPVTFTDEKYLTAIERDAGTAIVPVDAKNTKTGVAHYVTRGNRIRLFALMPDSVYLEITSDTADIDELIGLLASLE